MRKTLTDFINLLRSLDIDKEDKIKIYDSALAIVGAVITTYDKKNEGEEMIKLDYKCAVVVHKDCLEDTLKDKSPDFVGTQYMPLESDYMQKAYRLIFTINNKLYAATYHVHSPEFNFDNILWKTLTKNSCSYVLCHEVVEKTVTEKYYEIFAPSNGQL